MIGRREAIATCTGEQEDSRTAPTREQTETMSRGTRTTRLKRSSDALTGTRLRPGAPEHAGAAGSWQV